MAISFNRLKEFFVSKSVIVANSLEDFFSQLHEIISGKRQEPEQQEAGSCTQFSSYSSKEFISAHIRTNEPCPDDPNSSGDCPAHCINVDPLLQHLHEESGYYIFHQLNHSIGPKIDDLLKLPPKERHEKVTEMIHEEIQKFFH